MHHLAGHHLKTLVQRLADFFGYGQRIGAIVHGGQQHHKLIASDTGHGIRGTHAVVHALGHGFEQHITYRMPQGVVHRFEVVQIHV